MRGFVGVTVLLLGASLAGCLGSPQESSLADADPVAAPLVRLFDKTGANVTAETFGAELPVFDLVQASDRVSGEPTIAITRTGAIFYPAIDFDGPGTPATNPLPLTKYMRSTDGGATWTDKTPKRLGQDAHPYSFDPYVYADPTTGRIFAMDMGPDVTCNQVSWSDDDGETWTTQTVACLPGANDHPTLFAGPATRATVTSRYPNQLYLCTNQVSDTLCYQSPDGGLTWVPTQPAYVGVQPTRAPDSVGPPVRPLHAVCGGLSGHGHASWADGTIYLGREWCGEAAVSVSRDGGVSWRKVTITGDAHHSPADHDISVGTDRAGVAYAFWIGDRGRSAFLSVSHDMGSSWSEPMNVTAPGVTAMKFPSLVAGEAGRIAFLYVGTENPHGSAIGRLKQGCTDRANRACFEYAAAYNNTTWNGYITLSLNANSEQPVFATAMVNAADAPLKRGACSGRCFGNDDGSGGKAGSGGMYDFMDIDIDPMTGKIYAALVDVCSGDCDGPGKGKFDVEEHSVGVVARLLAGPRLLDAPIAER